VPAAASSPAPDAAAAECERAPGDAAACAHGDKKQEGSRAGTLFQYCRFRWRILESQCLKGLEPASSPSEKEATVIRIKSKILSVGLGTWRCNETITTEGPAANRHFAGPWYYRFTRHARQEKPLTGACFYGINSKMYHKKGIDRVSKLQLKLKLNTTIHSNSNSN